MCSGSNDPKRFLRELNEQNLARAIGWVAVADSKAKFMLSVILVIEGFLVTRLPSTADILVVLWKAQKYGLSFVCCAVLLGTFVALLVSLWFLVKIIYPKRKPHTGALSCLFYETITDMGIRDFQEQMSAISEDEAIRCLSDQTYNVSKVVKKKFDQLSTSIVWFWIGFFMLVLFYLVHTVFAKIWLSASAPA